MPGRAASTRCTLSLLLLETPANYAAADTHRTGLPTGHSTHACRHLHPHPEKWGLGEDTGKRNVGLDEDPRAHSLTAAVRVLSVLCLSSTLGKAWHHDTSPRCLREVWVRHGVMLRCHVCAQGPNQAENTDLSLCDCEIT